MRIVGIEFGSWSIKAVEMESKWRRIEVLDFHEARLPLRIQDPVADYKQALDQLLATLPSHADKIVTSIPASQTALRFLQMPIKVRKKVEQMYRFELEDTVPMKLEDSIVEHHIDRTPDGSLVFAAIAPKKFIQVHLEWLQKIGADPDWLTFDGMGFINLFLSVPPKLDEDATAPAPTLLVDLGHQKTNLAVIDQGMLKMFRSVPWGGHHITNSIAMTFSIALEEAEQLKAQRVKLTGEKTSPAQKELHEAVVQSISPLIADINHTLVSFRNQYQVTPTSLILTGGTSKLKGLDTFLSDSLALPVKHFEPFTSIGVNEELLKHDQHRFAEAWGRALVFARKSPLLFNFRKHELGKQTSLNQVGDLLKNPHITRLVRFGGVLAIILLIHVKVASIIANMQAANTNDALKKVFQDTFKTVPQKARNALTSNPKDLAKYIDSKTKEFEAKVRLASKSHVPMGSVVKKITASFPADVKVDVNTLEINDKSLTMKGVLYSGDLTKVTTEMKNSGLFGDVALQMDGQRFTYHANVVGR